MTKFHLRKRVSRYLRREKASDAGKIAARREKRSHQTNRDYGGRGAQAELPTRNLIVEMTRERGELQESLAKQRPLSDEVLPRLLSMVQLHCDGLSAAIQQCNQLIADVDEEVWGKGNTIITDSL
jgi:uncharacterized protein (DUF2164 family)